MNELNTLIADVFDLKPDQINDQLSPRDIDTWDSLGQLRLMAALEKHYKVSIQITEIFEIMNIGDIRKILERKGIK